ncbi:MAG: response regulator [Rubrivivax sp.]|nr:MAG: response regulator [Rubrivivax sp.]
MAVRSSFAVQPHWCVVGDAARLQQVIGNLLENALKFTPQGGEVAVALQRDATGWAVVKVSDNGQGIEAGFLSRVFERFQQQDATTTRRQGGLGIGLAIVRQLVLLHGGDVTAHSDGAGLGSTFTVRLPMADVACSSVPSAGQSTRAGSTDAARLDLVHVLLVEDEADVRAVTAHMLRSAGATVTVASSAEEGFRLMQQARPDVLLSDIGMPEQDGYELIRRVRALPAESGGLIPAAAFTAYASRDDVERALSAGFQGHVSKPAAPEALVAAVARLATAAR